MAPGGTPAFSQVAGLPGGRSALLITTAAYADAQLAWLRPPVSGAHDLAAALADPRAGGFGVDMLTDGTETETRLAISRFLAGRSAGDTVLLYLSCHAIRDRARLYFAATDTWLRYPQRSALPAAVVLSELDRCGAGNRLLILDCCFSGGFAEEKGELDVAAELALDGRGVAVLSGSRAREYSYEGRPIGPEMPRSVFTEGLAVGLATGAADIDGNGSVTVAEAYNYAYRYVSQNTPRQAPQYYLEDGHGEIVLARARPRTQPHARLSVAEPPAGPRPRFAAGVRESGTAGRRPDAPAVPVASGTPAPPAAHAAMHAAAPAAHSPGQRAPAQSAPAQPPAPQSPAAHAPAAHATADTSAVILEQDRDNAYCVAFSPDGRLLASAHEDGVCRLWDVPPLGRIDELRADGETIFSAVFSPDGTLVAAACADGAIRVWTTVGGGEPLSVLRRHTGWATAVAFTPDGSRVVSAGADGAVQFHNVGPTDPAGILRAGDGIVNAISLSPDGTLLAGGYETGAVTVWEVAPSRYQSLLGHAGHVNDVAFSPHSRALASAGKDGTVRLWR